MILRESPSSNRCKTNKLTASIFVDRHHVSIRSTRTVYTEMYDQSQLAFSRSNSTYTARIVMAKKSAYCRQSQETSEPKTSEKTLAMFSNLKRHFNSAPRNYCKDHLKSLMVCECSPRTGCSNSLNNSCVL